MGLSKSKGNMYSWVTHTHTHLGGVCPHGCVYCYVQDIERRFKQGRYAGELRLVEKEFDENYRSPAVIRCAEKMGFNQPVIFIEHCNDLWAKDVPDNFIERVLRHCRDYQQNNYVFQTKNPARFLEWLDKLPENRMLGCTIETTSWMQAKRAAPGAPSTQSRILSLKKLSDTGELVFVTIEPILKGNIRGLAAWMEWIDPEFVNVGADSKKSGLCEPSCDDVRLLLSELKRLGVVVKEKHNLDRLIGGE